MPTGALLGLDAVQAAALGEVRSVRLITRKPVAGLRNAPWFPRHGIDPDTLTEAVRLFNGTCRGAAREFPANVNVAVALSLAGIGPDRTTMEVWADPDARTNTHQVLVDAAAAQLDFSVLGAPSENPATGLLTPLSVVALLYKLTATLRVGT
ncbi:aspartate dehydrogenase domain-containing protein [Kineococcus sp. SYSU DK003]|uniref:aspartate dehydrogenase domain-containing protein n=1 Tax=Kineococcus sp. SYSU DK003 TaxID=3383124 RepID=UPI003D7D748A